MRRHRKTRKNVLSPALNALFASHMNDLKHSHETRKESVTLKSVATDTSNRVGTMDVTDTLGVRLPGDRWNGCTNLRTLRSLLAMVDDRGFERCVYTCCALCLPHAFQTPSLFFAHRSPHQIRFHSAFERCVSRVVYKGEWGSDRPAIMKHNNWDRCSSEVMVSCSNMTRAFIVLTRVWRADFDTASLRENLQHCNLRGLSGIVFWV